VSYGLVNGIVTQYESEYFGRCSHSLLGGLFNSNSVLDKTIAGVAVVIDAVLLLQLLDVL
jgi:hypothetical protein